MTRSPSIRFKAPVVPWWWGILGVLAAPVAVTAFPGVQVVRIDGSGPVSTGRRVEYEVRIDRSFADPNDDRQVHVRMGFWRDGDETPIPVEAFWMRPFRREETEDGGERWIEDGEASFRARFRARRPGTWRVAAEVTIPGEGTSQVETQPLNVTGDEIDPYVRRTVRDGRPALERDGRPFVPYGFNAGWMGPKGTGDYERWFARCSGGFSRKWMTSFDGTALEWLAGADGGAYEGLGRYNQKAAARLDRILELAESQGVALQLVFQQHSQFQTTHWSSWEQNPWNAANGGPCQASMEFFTNPDVVDGFDRRMRYLVARYGDSPAILAWELWNEVDLIEGYDPAIVSRWSRERVSLLRQWDPYGHLVTTSYALPAFSDQDWDFEGYDLVQLHTYLKSYWDALEVFAGPLLAYGKPVVVGEFGIDYLGEANRRDQEAVHLVNGTLWSVMLGYTGGVMSWWWDSWLEEPGPLAGWNLGQRALERLEVTGVLGTADGVRLEGGPPGGLWTAASRLPDGLLAWLHDPLSDWDRDPEGSWTVFEGVTLRLDGIEGRCREWTAVRVHEPALEAESGVLEESGAGGFRLDLPAFTRDLLLRIRCPAQPGPEDQDIPVPEDLGGMPEEEGPDLPPAEAGPDLAPEAALADVGPEDDPGVVPEGATMDDGFLADPVPSRRGGGCQASW
ncbi:MAG TPA: hypothetical protein PLQ97_14010 [Myxococcota bacterium]|nr:hypothetical protein [Myxococcota bacterium]HQK52275.1 hypothetical protein [Myxococcota bacterium]